MLQAPTAPGTIAGWWPVLIPALAAILAPLATAVLSRRQNRDNIEDSRLRNRRAEDRRDLRECQKQLVHIRDRYFAQKEISLLAQVEITRLENEVNRLRVVAGEVPLARRYRTGDLPDADDDDDDGVR